MLALIERFYIGARTDEDRDHAAVLQVQCRVENRVSIGLGGIHVGALIDEEFHIFRLIAKHRKKTAALRRSRPAHFTSAPLETSNCNKYLVPPKETGVQRRVAVFYAPGINAVTVSGPTGS